MSESTKKMKPKAILKAYFNMSLAEAKAELMGADAPSKADINEMADLAAIELGVEVDR